MGTKLVTIYKRDNLPALFFQLRNRQTKEVIQSPGVNDKGFFQFRSQQDRATTLFTQEMTKVGGGTTGTWQMNFPANSLDTLVEGSYEGQIYLDYNGLIQTVNDLTFFYLKEDFV